MSAAASSVGGLRKRSRLVALLLTFLALPVGFAYVRRLGVGIGLMLAAPMLMLAGGRLGIPLTPSGYLAMLGLMVALQGIALVLAWRSASALPEGATPRWYNRWYHYAWIALLGAVLANVMLDHRGDLFGFEPFRIPSMAMQPTLVPGDFITVDSRASAMADVRRGDIVTFVPAAHPRETWIKRVIGLPGETVLVRGNVVDIDGRPLAEPWTIVRQPQLSMPTPFERVVLGRGEYFLMGDNRPNSEDSRFTGPVPRAAIRGKARAIWFHVSPETLSIDTSRIGMLAHPGNH